VGDLEDAIMKLKAQMSDAERLSRHCMSMSLYDSSIFQFQIATILGALGIAFWPFLLAAIVLLVSGLVTQRKADQISPYGEDKT
jgi:hypothetical protein